MPGRAILGGLLLCICLYYSNWVIIVVSLGIYIYQYRPKHRRRVPAIAQFCIPVRYHRAPVRDTSEDPKMNTALRSVVDHVLKAYISGWHSQMSPHNSSFSDHVDSTIVDSLRGIQQLCEKVDWPRFLVGNLIPVLTSHMQAYSAANTEMKRSSQIYTRLSETDALQSRIASLYANYSPLHPNVQHFDAHLGEIANVLSPLLLPSELTEYPPTFSFMKSLLGNAILLPLCKLLTNPDFWNQQIVKGVEKALQDTARVNRLRKKVQMSLASELPPLTPETDEDGFAKFVNAVHNLESAALARQTHYTVSLLLQRLQHGNITSLELRQYRKRLNRAKNLLEDRIKLLDPHGLDPDDLFADFDLNSVLSDSKCLPFFAEYMRCQDIDYLAIYTQVNSLDTSSVDPLGGFQMEDAWLNTDSERAVFHIYNSLKPISEELSPGVIGILKKFVDEPSQEHYVEVQRISWKVKSFLVKRLGNFLPAFKQSIYFVQYMAVAGDHKTSIDRLQTDDINVDAGINNELVLEAFQDAIGGNHEIPVPKDDDDDSTPLADEIQMLLNGTTSQDFSTHLQAINQQVAQLESQINILKPLLDKAELTNDVGELNILRKSTNSLQREINRKVLVRDQLNIRSNQPSFYENFKLSIIGHMQNTDSSGEYTSYLVRVKNTLDEDEWTVSRRYRQFYALHKILRAQFDNVERLRFPKKKMVLKFQQRQFVEVRQLELSNYLSALLESDKISEHLALRMFLTSDSFPGSYYDYAPDGPKIKIDEDDKGFAQPIAEAFLVLFNIDEKIDWIRGKAIVIVIQQILGGTIEKRIREVGDSVPNHIPDIIHNAVDTIWPETPRLAVQRTLAERIHSRDHAGLLLKRITKAWLQKIVGAQKCDFAADLVLGMLQNCPLNKHLILTILDEIVQILLHSPRTHDEDHSVPTTPVL